MKYLKVYENFGSDVLVIVDVQKSYRKFFSEMYLHELKKYCHTFEDVYQIWDNHIDGKDVKDDYLFEEDPIKPIHNDLYNFPNQKDLIEKRYRYNVDVEFFRNKLDNKTYKELKSKESENKIKVGDFFEMKDGIFLVFVGNNHRWFECPKKLWDLVDKLKSKNVTIVGGADNECLEDIYVLMESMGIDIKRNWRFIWSASHCPI
jgi:hypothetical protein